MQDDNCKMEKEILELGSKLCSNGNQRYKHTLWKLMKKALKENNIHCSFDALIEKAHANNELYQEKLFQVKQTYLKYIKEWFAVNIEKQHD